MGRTGSLRLTRPAVSALTSSPYGQAAGGLPIGAVLAQGDVTTGFTPGSHGTTFGGNP